MKLVNIKCPHICMVTSAPCGTFAMLQPTLQLGRPLPLTTARQQPVQHDILSWPAQHEMHHDILVSSILQVNLLALLQSTPAQRPSRVRRGGEWDSRVFDSVDEEHGWSKSLNRWVRGHFLLLISKQGEQPLHGARPVKVLARATADCAHGRYLLDPPPSLVVEVVRNVIWSREAHEEVRIPWILSIAAFGGPDIGLVFHPLSNHVHQDEHGHMRPRRVSADYITDPSIAIAVISVANGRRQLVQNVPALVPGQPHVPALIIDRRRVRISPISSDGHREI
mmetsp:Transcript_20998/g.44955  ORF Transcript_20998/g.44955 Transcript_20998/m.44955 type:complete len:280 (+) Transcript_20998:146-985(+)